MLDFMYEMDKKLANGIKATCFKITVRGKEAVVEYADGTEVGPFIFGDSWGAAANPDKSAKLAGRLFRAGLMTGADDEAEAVRMVRYKHLTDQTGMVFPCGVEALGW